MAGPEPTAKGLVVQELIAQARIAQALAPKARARFPHGEPGRPPAQMIDHEAELLKNISDERVCTRLGGLGPSETDR